MTTKSKPPKSVAMILGQVAGNLEFLQACERNMPKGKRIVAVRADSAAYQAAIAGIPESDRKTFRDGKIAETIHGMNKTDKAFRLIVLRRPRDSAIRRSLAQAQNFPDLSSNESAGPCKKPLRDLLGYR
jgi:hypothetical protein